MPGQWKGSRRRQQLPTDWGPIRSRILQRDGGRCTHLENGHRCTAAATDVHHIGDPHDHSDPNLTSLCGPHHAAHTAADANAKRWAERTARPPEKHPGIR